MTSFYEKFGKRVSRARRKRKITQEELAFKIKVDYSYLNKIENGKANPSLKQIYRICKALKIKSSELIPF